MILRIDYEESEHADTFGFVSVRVVGGVHVGLLKKKLNVKLRGPPLNVSCLSTVLVSTPKRHDV